MNGHEFTPAALLDVTAAALYLSSRSGNPAVGERWISDIEHACSLIAERLRIGRARPDLGTGLRSLVHGSYTIFYHLTDDRAEIVRVLHQRQDADREFGLVGD